MRELMTTLLDAAGTVALAAGAGMAVGVDPRSGAGVIASGVVLLGAVRLIDWLGGRGERR